ncbi:MAG: response regulator [Undibacterium sp.]|nr:response regulator [Undibacterium sp.]
MMNTRLLISEKAWLERALDALDVLRDSVIDGRAIAMAMRDEGLDMDDQFSVAGADIVFAFADYFDSDLLAAENAFENVGKFFVEERDTNGVFFANLGRAIVNRKLGKNHKAHQICELELIPTIDDALPRLAILAFNIFAIVLQELEQTERAIRYFYRALELSHSINSANRIAQVTANLGEVLYVTGNVRAAEEFLQTACDLASTSSEKWLMPFSSSMLALCKISLGKFDEAYAAIQRYIENLSGGNEQTNSYYAFHLSVVAYTLAQRGEMHEALKLSGLAVKEVVHLEDAHLRPYIWWVSGFLNRRQGLYADSIVDLGKAIDQVGDSGYIHLPLAAMNELAEIYAEMGDWERAYQEQKRYQKLMIRAQERASKIQLENIKIRGEYKEAEQDRRLNARMMIERKTFDDELQRMLTERETILENSIFGMVFLNSEGRVQWANLPLCQIFDVEREEILGASIERFYVSRESYIENGAAVEQAVLRGEAFETELEMRRSDGSLFWVQFSGRAVNKRDLSYGTVWVVMDISSRRQLEDDLHRSENNYRLVINNVTEGIVVVQNERIVLANRVIQSLTGFSHDEIIGTDFTACFFAEDVALMRARYHGRLLGGEVEQYYQIRLQHARYKTTIWVEVSSVLIEWEGSPAILSFVSDLTQRKLLESQLKESTEEQIRLQTLQMQNELKVSELARRHAEETTAAKSMFLANMSHEIRTPMNAIIGMAHLALKTELNVKQKDYVEKIHKAGTSLMGIINDILDFSKIEAGKLDIEEVEFELDEVLSSVAVVTSEKAEQKGLEYLFDVSMDVPTRLKGDPLRLGQVLINLVNNAIKFTEEGEVCLSCRLFEKHSDAREGEISLLFEVRDTGVGMSEAQSSHLFLPFSQGDETTTRKFGGTGLGLSISKAMLNLMRGEISLKSVLGVGTSVTFILPLRYQGNDQKAEQECGQKREQGSEQGHEQKRQALLSSELFSKLRVLIVDDHVLAAQLLKTKLEVYGMSCEIRHTGEQALTYLLEQNGRDDAATKGGSAIDAIFVDLHMPYLDGNEVISQIRASKLTHMPKLALVGASASESLNYREVAVTIDAYLDKPFNTSNVLDCLVNMFAFHTFSGTTQHGTVLPKRSHLRVLLVEDNIVNQQIATELLEALEIEVDVATNGLLAVERLQEVGPQYYGMVFMDVQMPEMDGHEATKLLRRDARFATLPIVAMTAHALVVERERCFTSGMNAHIAKPIHPNELYQLISDWCTDGISSALEKKHSTNSHDDERGLLIPGLNVHQGLSRTMGDKVLYFKLLRLFIHDQAQTIIKIKDALKAQNWSHAENLCHTLKGVAGLIGAEVQCSAGKLEEMMRSAEFSEELERELVNCSAQLNSTIQAINDYLPHENEASNDTTVSAISTTLSSEEALQKLRHCYKLVSHFDADAIDALNVSIDALNLAFGIDVQKQIMRAANRYDFDIILSIMKGNAHMVGLELV